MKDLKITWPAIKKRVVKTWEKIVDQSRKGAYHGRLWLCDVLQPSAAQHMLYAPRRVRIQLEKERHKAKQKTRKTTKTKTR